MTPLEFVAFGVLCYALGLITGARFIPWLVDRGWFPIRPHHDASDGR